MHFGPIPLDEAEGAILAHSVVLPTGTLKKGRPLTGERIAALRAAGHRSVIAAKPDAGDVSEDAAAHRVARAVGGANVAVAEPFTGRANIFAAAGGLAILDVERLERLNRIDESITIATLMPFERVAEGQMLATVKIIPFAVPDGAVREAEAVASGGLVCVAPFTPRNAGLILTRVEATRPTLLAKRAKVIGDRLAALGATLGASVTAAHDEAAVAASLAELAVSGCDPILVFAASAIVDRGDVVPAALIRAGGRIERLGMPVDPGNLLLLGTLGATTVIGIPSCAGSPKLNGFDWVLERVAAGLAVTSGDIARMGIGGLLKEIPTRPQPRIGTLVEDTGRHAARIGCIVLAAGRSTRMGARNKLVEDLGGKAIVRHAVEAALASRAVSTVVVTGHRREAVEAVLGGLGVAIVHNPGFAAGLASSLAAGIAALPADLDGVLVMLGDMPGVTSRQLDTLIAAFAPHDSRAIVVPTFEGRRGNPVLWAREFFPALRAIAGDTGGRHLLGEHADAVVEVAIDTDSVLVDVDTPEALAAVRERAFRT